MVGLGVWVTVGIGVEVGVPVRVMVEVRVWAREMPWMPSPPLEEKDGVCWLALWAPKLISLAGFMDPR